MLTGSRRGLAALLLLALPGPALAQLDPGLKSPYQLKVVLHIGDHRALGSKVFRESTRSQLRDLLRLTFGELAKVEVVTDHDMLKEVVARGLPKTLDAWDELSNFKTHFVLIDFVDGKYRIRARQHDGLTGLPSAAMREELVADRAQVARAAARLVDQDFGLAGTVVKAGENTAEVAVRGGGLGVSLDRWLKAGDVFAVTRVTQEGEKPRATRLEWAVLQAAEQPAGGVVRCRYFHRYREDRLSEPAGSGGFRCLRLSTITAPLRLRLLDDKTGAPLEGLQVHVGKTGYDDPGAELTTGPDGRAVTADSSAGVAFVRVLSGNTVRARFPVVLVDDRNVDCRLSVAAEAVAQGQLELRGERWLRRVYDDLRLGSDRVRQLNASLNKSPEDALELARQGLKSMTQEVQSLREERDELRKAAAAQKGARLPLAEGEQRFAELHEQQKQLERFIDRLEKVISEEKSEKTRSLRTMLEQASLLETQAEYAAAIALYRKVLAESEGQEAVRKHLEKLEADWKPRDDAHAEARKFVYGDWQKKADTAGLKTLLPKAKEAFAAFVKAGDKLSPRKMLHANLAHAGSLKKRLEDLRRTPESEDRRAEAKLILQLGEELQRLHTEVTAFVGKKE